MMCVCIHRHGLIAARRKSIAIHAKNIKNGKNGPRDRVKEDTNFGGPAARAKKFIITDACVYGYCAATMGPFGLIFELYIILAWTGQHFDPSSMSQVHYNT